ncbi:MAG TPA: hypothetical protein VMM55_03540 [Thermohalobaculum sp.]|nr:hypothetical protein [Thermohalobaculum sp.]
MGGIFEVFAQPDAWVALAKLLVMEVVLGIDDLILISILTNKKSAHETGCLGF